MPPTKQISVEHPGSELQSERIAGDLEAAIVFVTAARDSYQDGKMAFGDACLEDARDLYKTALELLARLDTTTGQPELLQVKLEYLRESLQRVPQLRPMVLPSTGEAA